MLEVFMIVDDEEIAKFVSELGVNRLFIDLEYIGKAERQKGLDTWRSGQRNLDISRIRKAAPDAHLLVRINPLHSGSKQEIDDAIDRGANSIMLPMFRSTFEVIDFLNYINGRVEALPLIETYSALLSVPKLVEDVNLI